MLTFKELKRYKDGTADYSFSYDKEFEDFYKEKTGKSKLDDKEIGKFILKYLTELAGEQPEKSKRTRKKKAN